MIVSKVRENRHLLYFNGTPIPWEIIFQISKVSLPQINITKQFIEINTSEMSYVTIKQIRNFPRDRKRLGKAVVNQWLAMNVKYDFLREGNK